MTTLRSGGGGGGGGKQDIDDNGGSRKRKKTTQVVSLFALLGSALVKAAHRMLMKLIPGHKRQKMTSFSVTAQVKFSEVPTTIIIYSFNYLLDFSSF